jgi:purine-nucleoside phosphorylase
VTGLSIRSSDLPEHLASRLSAALIHLDEPVITARSWTTDAPYRETPAAIASATELGAACVEMEASALYALAAARRLDIVCLAHITNTMATAGDDFEKGDANGARASLALAAHVAHLLGVGNAP